MSQIILGELTKQEAFEKELIKRVRSYFKTQNKSLLKSSNAIKPLNRSFNL